MEEVVLTYAVWHDGDRNIWMDIAAALERPIFNRLKAVKIVDGAQSEVEGKEMQMRMKQHLSSCNARGLLVFSD
jgi:hypothetical protein